MDLGLDSGLRRRSVGARWKQRKTKLERRALFRSGTEIHKSVMQLHDPVRHCQTYPATGFLRREVEGEDFLSHILRDSRTLVFNLSQSGAILTADGDVQGASLGHGLNTVKHHVQDRLLNKV